VTNVLGSSPAAAAGLRAGKKTAQAFGIEFPASGDVIVSIAGEPVRASEDIARIVTNLSPGQVVRFGIVRGGSRLDLPVRLSERSETG
jgi:S1-C subfamily serine protease